MAICGNTSTSNVLYSEWYCKRKSIGRSIITSILPTILLMLWQNLIMPNALYRCASPSHVLMLVLPSSHDLRLEPACHAADEVAFFVLSGAKS